jgi:hypothetical protein
MNRHKPRLQPEIAFEMIGSMKGLRKLVVHIEISNELCDFQVQAQRITQWRVKESILDKIRNYRGWTVIKGLQEKYRNKKQDKGIQEFNLDIEDWQRSQDRIPIARAQLQRMPGDVQRWNAVENEIRKVLLEQSPITTE